MHAVSPNISLLKRKQLPKGDDVTPRDIIKYTIQNAVLESRDYELHAGEDVSSMYVVYRMNYFQLNFGKSTLQVQDRPIENLQFIHCNAMAM